MGALGFCVPKGPLPFPSCDFLGRVSGAAPSAVLARTAQHQHQHQHQQQHTLPCLTPTPGKSAAGALSQGWDWGSSSMAHCCREGTMTGGCG